MATELKWLDEEQTILYVAFFDTWTWDEFVDFRRKVRNLIDSSPHPVDRIIDLTRLQTIPPDALRQVRAAFSDVSPNLRLVVMMITNPTLLHLYHLAMRLYNNENRRISIHLAVTLDEALQLIYRERKKWH